jgi:hypothetical protein
MEPAASAGVVVAGRALRSGAMQWRSATTDADAMRGTDDDEISYATGWTISGLATLGTIVAIWLLGI